MELKQASTVVQFCDGVSRCVQLQETGQGKRWVFERAWPGKRAEIREAPTPSLPALAPGRTILFRLDGQGWKKLLLIRPLSRDEWASVAEARGHKPRPLDPWAFPQFPHEPAALAADAGGVADRSSTPVTEAGAGLGEARGESSLSAGTDPVGPVRDADADAAAAAAKAESCAAVKAVAEAKAAVETSVAAAEAAREVEAEAAREKAAQAAASPGKMSVFDAFPSARRAKAKPLERFEAGASVEDSKAKREAEKRKGAEAKALRDAERRSKEAAREAERLALEAEAAAARHSREEEERAQRAAREEAEAEAQRAREEAEAAERASRSSWWMAAYGQNKVLVDLKDEDRVGWWLAAAHANECTAAAEPPPADRREAHELLAEAGAADADGESWQQIGGAVAVEGGGGGGAGPSCDAHWGGLGCDFAGRKRPRVQDAQACEGPGGGCRRQRLPVEGPAGQQLHLVLKMRL